MSLRIEDYALIGDCHTAALVGKDGSIDWLCLPRFDSGACFAGPDSLQLCTPLEVRGESMTTVAEFTVEEGQRIPLVLQWQPSNEEPSCFADAEETINKADEWWRAWAGRSTYDGPYRAQVVRSLITLKAQTFAPTGGLVAAPTTSLPEQIGSVRN